MSKAFPTRSSVKTSGRGASNQRQTPSDNLSRRSQGRGLDNSTQTNRGRGIRSSSSVLNSTSTLTSSSTASRGRGATRTTSTTNPRMQSNANNRRMEEDFLEHGATSSPQRPNRLENSDQAPDQQQGQYAGGFTKFEPNTKKRQQVSEMARKETQEYERYKKDNAMKYCNYVGTTGGGEMSEDMVRRKQASDVRNQKFNRLQNQQKRREERRDVEQKEIDSKRAEARRKADENASNHYKTAKPEDIRRKREEFLRQLESQSSPTTTTATTSSTQNVPVNQSASLASSNNAAPPPPPPPTVAPMRTRIKPEPSSPTNLHRQDLDPNRFSTNQNSRSSVASSATAAAATEYYDHEEEEKDDKKFQVEDFPEEVMTLAAMFPDIDLTYLNGLYEDAGSVEAVLDIIGV